MVETLVVLDPLADLALRGRAVRGSGRERRSRCGAEGSRAARSRRGAEPGPAGGSEANADLTDEPARWQIGALRLSAELASLAALIRVAPAQALARAHAGRSRRSAG